MVTIKSKHEIEKMREACRVAALAQKAIEEAIRPGVSTWELDKIAENTMRANGAIPAEKGYPSGVKGVPAFPGSICASINDEVIHGIPSKKEVVTINQSIKIESDNNYLAIPKIEFYYRFYDLDSKYNSLNYGLEIYYQDPVVILGHSGTGALALFNDLDNLEVNDKIIYNSQKYQVTKKYLKFKSKPLTLESDLILVTCSKKYSDRQIVITAKIS